jgi:D-glycero-D-manno-heptose 1,7-bisphosphate phosphatase
MYCDNYWPMQIEKLLQQFNDKGKSALVTVYRNTDNYSKNNLRINDDKLIEVYDKTRTASNLQGVDIGFFILKKKVLTYLPENGNVNFEKTVFPVLIREKEITAFITDHRYYSIGSHERLKLTDDFLAGNPVILLDRDGVLNKKAPKADYIKNRDEWEWIEGSKEAICLLKKNNYKIILISNQAGIARGKMTVKDLEDIHERMKNDLRECGGGIDAIYYCPHGWDDNCECRKPKPGMIFQAQRDFNIDLSRTYFIGDDERDKEAGDRAGCKTILVDQDQNLLRVVNERIPGIE